MKPHKFVVVVSIIAVVMAAVYVVGQLASVEELARYYYNNTRFEAKSKTVYAAVITDDGEVIEYINENDGSLFRGYADRGGKAKPAKAVEAEPEAVRRALERVGVEGELLGTYVYNSTHVVTLVKNLYAVVWNNETAAAYTLKFEKYLEDGSSTSRRYGDYTFVASWRSVGYRETSGVLPFGVYRFEDWVEGTFYTPGGYFKVVAYGRFTIIYGAAVYVEDRSYSQLTDPTMGVCRFVSRAGGSGTPLAGIRAEGMAIQITCPILATRLTTFAFISYDAWLGRSADATGNRELVPGCIC